MLPGRESRGMGGGKTVPRGEMSDDNGKWELKSDGR